MEQSSHLARKRRDVALLILVLAYMPTGLGLLYVGNHFRIGGGDVLLVIGIILSYLALCGFVALRILIRCAFLSIHRSPLLLASAAMLAALLWCGNYAEFAIDWVRFQVNREYYVEKVATGVSRFDWGETGFLTSSNSYQLIFDEAGKAMASNGRVVDRGSSKCSTSVSRLSGHFYSEKTACG